MMDRQGHRERESEKETERQTTRKEEASAISKEAEV